MTEYSKSCFLFAMSLLVLSMKTCHSISLSSFRNIYTPSRSLRSASESSSDVSGPLGQCNKAIINLIVYPWQWSLLTALLESILESPCPCVRLFVYMSSGLCPEDIPWTLQPSVSKPGTVVIRSEPVCHAQELRCYRQGQGHNKCLYNHNITVFVFLFVCLFLCVLLWQQNLVCW